LPRRSNNLKHPAITARTLRNATDQDDAELESLPGWDTFSPDQKRFLTILPYYATKSAAAQSIGFDSRWWSNGASYNRAFKEAAELREDTRVRILRSSAIDMLGKTALRLDEMLDPGVPKSVQMDAIKHVHNIVGIIKPKDNGDSDLRRATLINTKNLQMFEGSKTERKKRKDQSAPVVETEVMEGDGVNAGEPDGQYEIPATVE